MTTYRLPADTHTDWALNESREFIPDARQALVISTVQQCLDEGLYYTRDVLARCRQQLPLTPEDAARGNGRVDGGDFGMDLYYARAALCARAGFAADDVSILEMSPKVGQSLPHLMFNDCKLIRAVKITAVSDDSRSVTFTGKRGALAVTACRTPRELQRAMRNAAERTAALATA